MEEPEQQRLDFTARYTQHGQVLGEGTFGQVYRATDITNGRQVAIKRLRLEPHEEGIPGHMLREISFLKSIQHDNIVKLHDVCQRHDRLYLVFEFADHDLRRYLDANVGNLALQGSSQQIKRLLYQLLEAVQLCHSHGVLHRDLKPQNVLIDAQGQRIKLADFGLARTFGTKLRVYTHEVVTLWYRAPELLLGEPKYTSAVDVWAVGCIFAEMVTKQALFPGEAEIDQLYKIFRVLGTPTEHTWPGVSMLPDYQLIFPQWAPRNLAELIPTLDPQGIDLLQRMLTYSPRHRVTALEALQHPFFNSLRAPQVPPAGAPPTPQVFGRPPMVPLRN